MLQEKANTFCPASRQEWRQWLQDNHRSQQSVWLVYYKKKTGIDTISWSDAVEEALCFGWIDSKAKPIDEKTFMHFFCQRKPGGTWSKINKEKVKRLIQTQCMTAAGLEVIKAAKKNGSWTILDEVEALIIPKDLATAFRKNSGSKTFFLSLSKSVKKAILQWIVLAKRPETREKRIAELAELAALGLKPKHF